MSELVEARGEPIHLLLAADAKYGAYAGITVASVLRSNPRGCFHIHLLSNGVRRRDLCKLGRLIEAAGSRISVYQVGDLLAANPHLSARGHLSPTAYARLMLTDVLPESLHRVIYLDCDIICTGDISPLWQAGKTVAILGAVPEQDGTYWKALAGLPAESRYFNSGVLVVNVEEWRSRGLAREIVRWIVENPDRLNLADQDAINAVLSDAITPLPECWNLQLAGNSTSARDAPGRGGALLHYNGERKPWRYRFRGPGAEIFRAAKRASPWRYKLPTFRLVYRFQKAINKRLAGRTAGGSVLSSIARDSYR